MTGLVSCLSAVFLKEKKLIKDDVNADPKAQMTVVNNDYYELDVSCKVNLKRGNGKPADYYISFGVRGWYRYNTNKGAWYAPASIIIA